MKAFVITIRGHEYSENKTSRCIETATNIGEIAVERFYCVPKKRARATMNSYGLKWTWANNNTRPSVCPITNLQQRPYYDANLDTKISCSMSHYLLWKRCVELNEPILILEHDAVFIHKFPEFDFKGICQINDPKGGGRRGKFLQQEMIQKYQNTEGVNPKTLNTMGPMVPDGLVGNSAYVIKPFAAQELIDKYHELGVWPNDATMCIQLFPYLQEYYPFITKVEQGISTSST